MIQIGRYRIGFAPASMAVVFVVLTACAVVVALDQTRPEWSMTFGQRIMIYEGMAIVVTLIYGIFAHFVFAFVDKRRNQK